MAEGRSDVRYKGNRPNRVKEITLNGREGKIIKNSHDWAIVDVAGEGWAFFNSITVNKTAKFHVENISECFPVGSVVRLNARIWLEPEGSIYTNSDVRSCQWIVNSVRSKPDLVPLPVMFKTAFNFDSYNVPTDVLPAEKVGEAIMGLTKRLKVINGMSVTQLANTFSNEYSNIPLNVRTILCNADKLRALVRCLPRYFLLTDDRIFIYACREKDDVDIEIGNLIPDGWRPSDPITVNVGHNTHIIEDPTDCAAIVEEILSGPKPITIALDCEGESLGKTGKLTLLQMSTWSGQAYLVDVLAILEPNQFFVEGGLKKLLEDPEVIKVIHDCRADNAALYHQYDVSLSNVFDTAVAYTVIMEQCHANRSNGGSLEHLCELFSKPLVTKTKTMKKKMAYVKGFWSRRPMTPEMIRYAAVDALSLVPNVYVNMKRLIHASWQSRYDTLITEKLLKRK